MLNAVKSVMKISNRTFKNFGHKRQLIPGVTLLWHGFLTFSFIGLGLKWEFIARLLFGEDHDIENVPWKGKANQTETSPD